MRQASAPMKGRAIDSCPAHSHPGWQRAAQQPADRARVAAHSARLPSRIDVDLDEDATVDASAQGIGVVPVLRPRLERWFEAALVVDHSRRAEMWAQTVIEIERMLAFSGIFRDVRTFRLLHQPTLRLLNESGQAVRPGVLRDPTARRDHLRLQSWRTDAGSTVHAAA